MSFTSLLEPMTEEALKYLGPIPTITLTCAGSDKIFVNECVPLPPGKNIHKERSPTPRDLKRLAMFDKSYFTVTNAMMILSYGFTYNPNTRRLMSNLTFKKYKEIQNAHRGDQYGRPISQGPNFMRKWDNNYDRRQAPHQNIHYKNVGHNYGQLKNTNLTRYQGDNHNSSQPNFLVHRLHDRKELSSSLGPSTGMLKTPRKRLLEKQANSGVVMRELWEATPQKGRAKQTNTDNNFVNAKRLKTENTTMLHK